MLCASPIKIKYISGRVLLYIFYIFNGLEKNIQTFSLTDLWMAVDSFENLKPEIKFCRYKHLKNDQAYLAMCTRFIVINPEPQINAALE